LTLLKQQVCARERKINKNRLYSLLGAFLIDIDLSTRKYQNLSGFSIEVVSVRSFGIEHVFKVEMVNIEDSFLLFELPASFFGISKAKFIRKNPILNVLHVCYCLIIVSGQFLLGLYCFMDTLFDVIEDRNNKINITLLFSELLLTLVGIILCLAVAKFIFIGSSKLTELFVLINNEMINLKCTVVASKSMKKYSVINSNNFARLLSCVRCAKGLLSCFQCLFSKTSFQINILINTNVVFYILSKQVCCTCKNCKLHV